MGTKRLNVKNLQKKNRAVEWRQFTNKNLFCMHLCRTKISLEIAFNTVLMFFNITA